MLGSWRIGLRREAGRYDAVVVLGPHVVAAIGRVMTPIVAEKVNILLVDDQPQRLLSYQSVLQELGQHLFCARSGLEALEQLMKREFALVLLDVSMPGMDGFETAAMIHEHHVTSARRSSL